MIRKFVPNAKRLTTGVLIAGVIAAGAVALAEPASAAPTFDSVTFTCTNQGANGTGSDTDCVVPTGTESVTLTATVENTVNGSEQPVPGVEVDFSVTDGDGTVTPITDTTGADGQATTALTPSTTVADEVDTVQASIGSTTQSATVEFQTPVPTTLTLTPGDRQVLSGSQVSETANLVDQFGNPATVSEFPDYASEDDGYIEIDADGRNSESQSTDSADASSVTLTYIDSGTNGDQDTFSADAGSFGDNEDNYIQSSNNPVVTYVDSSTPSNVSLNFVSSSPCPTNTVDPNTVDGATQEVCAVVTSSTGDKLQNQSVTFTVDKGTVAASASGTTASGASTSVTTTTDGNGIAVAYVRATMPGAQTITGSVSGAPSSTLTDTYQQGADPTVGSVSVAPGSHSITAGQSWPYSASVLDVYGNPIDDATVSFSVSGPGSLTSASGTTNSSGVASTTVQTQSGQTGSGTVTASVTSGGATKSGSATYTIAPVVAKSVTVSISGAGTIGAAGTARATVTATNGKPLVGGTVSFSITGATLASGKSNTSGNGQASFHFKAQHAGKFTVTATASSAPVSGKAESSTATTTLSTKLSQVNVKKGKISQIAQISMAISGVKVHFYQVNSDGSYDYLGSATTNSNGVAQRYAYPKSGSTFQAVARVVGESGDYTKNGPYSGISTIRVQ